MQADVVIVGGGVMGAAVAWFLKRWQRFPGTVVVIERDTTFARASSALSASAIRQQFTTPVSVAMSGYGWEFLSDADSLLGRSLGLVERGYLLLGNRHLATPDAELLDAAALASQFPWLDASDVGYATWGTRREGWFDGPGLHSALLEDAKRAGASVVQARALAYESRGPRLQGLCLDDGGLMLGGTFVHACGAWSAELLTPLDIRLPVVPRKRDVYLFTCPSPPPPLPMIWDPSGLWLRPEGAGFMCGRAPAPSEDPDGAELIPDYARFDTELWPALARRVPAFEAIRLTGAWSGYYEYCTFDQNGFVGPVPGFDNLLLACGFSGHGMQHAPAVGRGVAELVDHGDFRTLDLAPLGFERLSRRAPIVEANVA